MKQTDTTTAAPPAAVYIETIDGRVYPGRTIIDALHALRAAAWGSPGASRSLREYMTATAMRVGQWNKRPVRTGSPEEFVADMQEAGLFAVRRLS